MPKVGIISQARMTSTRLPGKVLKTVRGKSLLGYHLDRLNLAGFPIVVATTVNQTDQPIVDFCKSQGLPIFRGDEQDVLSRFYGAALEHAFDIVVRVTSDCPLIDGNLIKQSVKLYEEMKQPWLYMSNALERTYPRGFDFEIFSFEMLAEAQKLASTPVEREHVTPYFYQNKHSKTVFHHVKRSPDMSRYRLTVDEPADFQLIETLIEKYDCAQLTENEICQVLQQHPELAEINAFIEQKKL